MKSSRPIFKSLKEVQQGISELSESSDFDGLRNGETIAEFERRYHALFSQKIGAIPNIVQLIKNENLELKMYRLRRNSPLLNTNLISTYSHPPANVLIETQRANLPYHPVFYASDNPSTVIAELAKPGNPIIDETYYLSEWLFRPNVTLRLCAFLFDIVDSESIMRYVEKNFQMIREILKEYSVDQQDGVIEYLKFLSKMFIYDNTYNVSAYIAHSQLYAQHEYRPDMFLYPSIQSDRKSVNFALHPNAVTEKLLLENVYQLNINSVEKEKNQISITINKCAENRDGIFHWFGINDKGESQHKGFEKLKQALKYVE
jgi:hypothetical protein